MSLNGWLATRDVVVAVGGSGRFRECKKCLLDEFFRPSWYFIIVPFLLINCLFKCLLGRICWTRSPFPTHMLTIWNVRNPPHQPQPREQRYNRSALPSLQNTTNNLSLGGSRPCLALTYQSTVNLVPQTSYLISSTKSESPLSPPIHHMYIGLSALPAFRPVLLQSGRYC